MLTAMIVAPVYAGLHLIVYLWPRAAKINAFLRGKSIAEYAWAPYFTELKTKEVSSDDSSVYGGDFVCAFASFLSSADVP